MSGYSEMYREQQAQHLIRQWCPKWAENESERVRHALAQGAKDAHALHQAQDAFALLTKSLGRNGL